jgi:hypothetical protein
MNHGSFDIYAILSRVMSDNGLIAIIGGSSTFLTALASLLLVYRGFSSIERRLEIIEGDLKQFYKDLTRHENEISSIKERLK